jgi:hypothetical protein
MCRITRRNPFISTACESKQEQVPRVRGTLQLELSVGADEEMLSSGPTKKEVEVKGLAGAQARQLLAGATYPTSGGLEERPAVRRIPLANVYTAEKRGSQWGPTRANANPASFLSPAKPCRLCGCCPCGTWQYGRKRGP